MAATRKRTQAVRDAQNRYNRKNVRQVILKLNRKTDDDILGWLDEQANKQGYIKDLIRADMAANGHATANETETDEGADE